MHFQVILGLKNDNFVSEISRILVVLYRQILSIIDVKKNSHYSSTNRMQESNESHQGHWPFPAVKVVCFLSSNPYWLLDGQLGQKRSLGNFNFGFLLDECALHFIFLSAPSAGK